MHGGSEAAEFRRQIVEDHPGLGESEFAVLEYRNLTLFVDLELACCSESFNC